MASKLNPKPSEERRKNKRCTPVNLETQSAIRRFEAEFISTTEAAAELGLTINTMRKYCQDGCFTNTKVFGFEWVISRYDVDWWKEHRRGRMGRPKTGE